MNNSNRSRDIVAIFADDTFALCIHSCAIASRKRLSANISPESVR